MDIQVESNHNILGRSDNRLGVSCIQLIEAHKLFMHFQLIINTAEDGNHLLLVTSIGSLVCHNIIVLCTPQFGGYLSKTSMCHQLENLILYIFCGVSLILPLKPFMNQRIVLSSELENLHEVAVILRSVSSKWEALPGQKSHILQDGQQNLPIAWLFDA